MKRAALALLAATLVLLAAAPEAGACPACMQFLSKKLGMGYFTATMIMLSIPLLAMGSIAFFVLRALREPPRYVPARERFRHVGEPTHAASPDSSPESPVGVDPSRAPNAFPEPSAG